MKLSVSFLFVLTATLVAVSTIPAANGRVLQEEDESTAAIRGIGKGGKGGSASGPTCEFDPNTPAAVNSACVSTKNKKCGGKVRVLPPGGSGLCDSDETLITLGTGEQSFVVSFLFVLCNV